MEPVYPNKTKFTPGRFELLMPNEVKMDVKQFKLNRDASGIFSFGSTFSATSKTLGPFAGEIHEDATGQPIATFNDIRVSVTSLIENNKNILLLSLEYFITSHGWRSDPGQVSQQVLYRNSGGGVMFSEAFTSFVLNCNDNRRYDWFQVGERDILGWIDDLEAFTYLVNGSFFKC